MWTDRSTNSVLGLRPWTLMAAVAYSAVAMLFEPFSGPQRVATGGAIAVVVLVALSRRWLLLGPPHGHEGGERLDVRSLGVWIALFATAAAVQLWHFTDWPREVYPTLSSLAGAAFQHYPVRVAAFLTWLALGWYVIDR